MKLAILGAGPHGRQLASLYGGFLFDDHLPFHREVASVPEDYQYLIGAAWPKVRRQIAQQVPHLKPLDDGTVIFPRASIGTDVEIGEHTHVGFNAVVSHGCRVGSFVNICPGAVVSGEAVIEDDVFIGAGAVVIHGGLTVGKGAIIGAGAVVLRDVPPGVVAYGNPARLRPVA